MLRTLRLRQAGSHHQLARVSPANFGRWPALTRRDGDLSRPLHQQPIRHRALSHIQKSAVPATRAAAAAARSNSTMTDWKPPERTDRPSFRYEDYDIVGFDLDATLLRYNVEEMVRLVYGCLRQFLVDEKQYPDELLQARFDRSFVQKGLVIDDVRGNVIKLGVDGEVLRAAHGTRPLTPDEIQQHYGPERRWSVADQLAADPLSTWNTPLEKQIRALMDCFDMAAALNFAQAVDALDRSGKGSRQPYLVWPDVLDGLVRIYARENFANGLSPYFEALRRSPDRYVLRSDPVVVEFLRELRRRGKLVFLLTGSYVDFANLTASYAFRCADWYRCFDSVTVFARKPGFFTDERPFLEVDELKEMPDRPLPMDAVLALGRTYTQGNWPQLRATLAHRLGKDPAEVRCLYVGDNLVQDVFTPVTHHRLDAMAVSDELLREHKACASPWGSYFAVDGKSTLWAGIIARHARFCVPAISTVAASVREPYRES